MNDVGTWLFCLLVLALTGFVHAGCQGSCKPGSRGEDTPRAAQNVVGNKRTESHKASLKCPSGTVLRQKEGVRDLAKGSRAEKEQAGGLASCRKLGYQQPGALECVLNAVAKGENSWCATSSGTREGPWVAVTRDRKAVKGHYSDGKLQGMLTVYGGTGNQIVRWTLNGGKPHGRYTEWYPNGRKRAEGRFAHGVKNGLWTAWKVNGDVASELTYSLGKKKCLLSDERDILIYRLLEGGMSTGRADAARALGQLGPRVLLGNQVGSGYGMGGLGIETQKTRCEPAPSHKLAFAPDEALIGALREKEEKVQEAAADGLATYYERLGGQILRTVKDVAKGAEGLVDSDVESMERIVNALRRANSKQAGSHVVSALTSVIEQTRDLRDILRQAQESADPRVRAIAATAIKALEKMIEGPSHGHEFAK